MLALLAQYSASGTRTYSPAATAVGVVLLVIGIYCAYKTISNGHTILFVLGFCFPICWLIGALMGKKYRY